MLKLLNNLAAIENNFVQESISIEFRELQLFAWKWR